MLKQEDMVSSAIGIRAGIVLPYTKMILSPNTSLMDDVGPLSI